MQWEKRLIEEFRETGKEICDNNKDDNGNGQIDCQEDQCGGKVCGWTEIEISTEPEIIAPAEAASVSRETLSHSSEVNMLLSLGLSCVVVILWRRRKR